MELDFLINIKKCVTSDANEASFANVNKLHN